jgi:hypothetical protein
MQTFLTIPSTDFSKTAKTLDNKRLNKQALEAWQILMTNLSMDPDGNYRQPKGWYNHPAVKMWRGYELNLYFYIEAMTDEWINRGYKTTIFDKASFTMEQAESKGLIYSSDIPYWMRNKILYSEITSSHRTALLCKEYDWYSNFNWKEDFGSPPESYEYVWFK